MPIQVRPHRWSVSTHQRLPVIWCEGEYKNELIMPMQQLRNCNFWLCQQRDLSYFTELMHVTNFNPFTAPVCPISGLKDARTPLQTVYFPVLQHVYFQCCAFWWKSFHVPVQKKKAKRVRVSNLVLFLVVFKWHHGSIGVNAFIRERGRERGKAKLCVCE